jgi:hypothetical protein
MMCALCLVGEDGDPGAFIQILEYRAGVFPYQPKAGLFFADMGGFLTGLVLGFRKLRPSPTDPKSWAGETAVSERGDIRLSRRS